ncbi:MAG: hypothetical protein K2Z81_06745 [Cyanobacteria bacterium]|nr:hypothetical protein [Cyanobacteriota bacterium]
MYKHTQCVPPGVLAAFGTVGGLSSLFAPKALRAVTGLSIAGALFAFRSLTVTVDGSDITLEFGNVLKVKTIPLQDIESVKVKQTHAVIGWGVHFVGDGWLYRVDGQEAVQVKLKSGEKIFIGSDEPVELEAAINSALVAHQHA